MIDMPKGMSLQERATWKTESIQGCVLKFEEMITKLDEEMAKPQKEKAELEAIIGTKLAGRSPDELTEREDKEIFDLLESLENLEDKIGDALFKKDTILEMKEIVVNFHQKLLAACQKGLFKLVDKAISKKLPNKLCQALYPVQLNGLLKKPLKMIDRFEKRMTKKLDRARRSRSKLLNK